MAGATLTGVRQASSVAVPVAYGTGHAALPNPLGNGAHQIACATSFKSEGSSLTALPSRSLMGRAESIRGA
jgi:hypothetical protein